MLQTMNTFYNILVVYTQRNRVVLQQTQEEGVEVAVFTATLLC